MHSAVAKNRSQGAPVVALRQMPVVVNHSNVAPFHCDLPKWHGYKEPCKGPYIRNAI